MSGKIVGSVRGQVLHLIYPPLVEGTVDYLTAEFSFSGDWDGLSKWAHFKQGSTIYDVPLTNDAITEDQHLNLRAGTWDVYLHGSGDNRRITTTTVRMKVLPYLDEDGEPLPEVPLTFAEVLDQRAQRIQAVAYAVEAGESARKEAERSRELSEFARVQAEAERTGAEADRASAEAVRASAETARKNAEQDRVSAENSRSSAEDTRKQNEEARQAAEAIREQNEEARVEAEKNRKDGITPHIGDNGNWYLGDTDTGKPSRGEAGGWYTPSVTQPDENTLRMAFSPSKEGMPVVAHTDITLPGGGSGSVAVDSTLTVSGQAADAKATGDAIRSLSEKKVSLPKDDTGAVQNGTVGQILQTNGDGTTQWVDKPEGGGGTSSETTNIPVTAEKAFAASVLELNHVSDNQYVAQHDSVLFEATEDTTLSVGNDNMIGAPYSSPTAVLPIAAVAYTEIENGYALDYADDYTGTKNFQHQRFGFNVGIKSGKTYTLRFYVNASSLDAVYLFLTNDKKEPGTLMGGGSIRNGTVCQITFTTTADYAFARIAMVNLPAEITKITLCEGEVPLEYGSGSESYSLLAGEKVWLSGVRKLNCTGTGKFYESPLALTSLNGIQTKNGAINSCATNKVWVNMGDSIWTFGASTGGIGTITDYMLALCGGTWHNIATGGTTMASRPGSYAGTYDALDFWKIADAIVAGNYTDAKAAAAELTSNFANIDNVNWSAVDYVTVAYGTNDLAFGAAIDNESNLFDTATICGALRYGIKAINSAYPNIRFKVLGVLYRNADSVPMTKIVECNNALKNAAAYVGAEFIDGYGINEGNRSTYLYDGTHPNGEGKQRIAETLARNIHDIWYS